MFSVGGTWEHYQRATDIKASVLLHELGHARVAQHFGVQVVDIVLWPLGGMARMTQLPEDPKVEGWVAAAGPLVNLGCPPGPGHLPQLRHRR